MASTDPSVNEKTQDIVVILRADNFQPIFAGANPMSVTVREISKLTTFAVEDGTSRTDHRVIDPVEIDMPFLLTEDTRHLYELIRQAYRDGADLIVQTKVASYKDMMIFEMPHDENPDQGDAIPIAVKLREVRTVKPQFGSLSDANVKKRSQSGTVDRGSQQTNAATDKRTSVLYDIVN